MIPCQPPPHLVQLRSPPTLPGAESSAPEQKFSSQPKVSPALQPRGFACSATQSLLLSALIRQPRGSASSAQC